MTKFLQYLESQANFGYNFSAKFIEVYIYTYIGPNSLKNQ